MAECAREVKVGFEEWVEAKVSAKAQPVVCVDDVVIIPVDDVNIPTYCREKGWHLETGVCP